MMMTDTPKESRAREIRLAEALRANLKRRKDGARRRPGDAPSAGPAPSRSGEPDGSQ
jgi:hypothetical protein